MLGYYLHLLPSRSSLQVGKKPVFSPPELSLLPKQSPSYAPFAMFQYLSQRKTMGRAMYYCYADLAVRLVELVTLMVRLLYLRSKKLHMPAEELRLLIDMLNRQIVDVEEAVLVQLLAVGNDVRHEGVKVLEVAVAVAVAGLVEEEGDEEVVEELDRA